MFGEEWDRLFFHVVKPCRRNVCDVHYTKRKKKKIKAERVYMSREVWEIATYGQE